MTSCLHMNKRLSVEPDNGSRIERGIRSAVLTALVWLDGYREPVLIPDGYDRKG